MQPSYKYRPNCFHEFSSCFTILPSRVGERSTVFFNRSFSFIFVFLNLHTLLVVQSRPFLVSYFPFNFVVLTRKRYYFIFDSSLSRKRTNFISWSFQIFSFSRAGNTANCKTLVRFFDIRCTTHERSFVS